MMNRRFARALWVIGVPLIALAIGIFFGYFLRGYRMAPASARAGQKANDPFPGTWVLAGAEDPEEPGSMLLLHVEGGVVLGNTATMQPGSRLAFDSRNGQSMNGRLTDSDGNQTPARIEATPDGQKLILTLAPPGGGTEYLLYLRSCAPEGDTN
jgi:hypothetical protein